MRSKQKILPLFSYVVIRELEAEEGGGGYVKSDLRSSLLGVSLKSEVQMKCGRFL